MFHVLCALLILSWSLAYTKETSLSYAIIYVTTLAAVMVLHMFS